MKARHGLICACTAPVLLVVKVALCAAPAPGLAAGESGPISLAEYRTALRRARGEVVAYRIQMRAIDARSWVRLTNVLPLQVRVRMTDGSVVPVNNQRLSELLDPARGGEGQALSPQGTQSLARLVVLVDSLLAAMPPTIASGDGARAERVLREVLSRPEYRPKGPSWEERFLRWLVGIMRRLFPGTAPALQGDDRLARMLLVGVVLLLAVLVARILMLVLPDLRLHRRKDNEAPAGEVRVPDEPEALLAAAEREAAAGRYREALRLAYRAMVVRLDRAGVLPEDRSRTHWELLKELRRTGRDPLYQTLAPTTRLLDERLYGGRLATEEDYRACRAAHDKVEGLLCAPA